MRSLSEKIENDIGSEELDEEIFNIIFTKNYMRSIGINDELFKNLSEIIQRC